MLNLTDSTIHKLKEVLKQGNFSDHGIRIFVVPGG